VAAGLTGIDVAKGWLDAAFSTRLERVDNNAAGLRRLIGMLRHAGVRTVGIEPTGGYERLAVSMLRAAGFAVRMVDSWRLRQFAKARGVRAKTDPIDARMIATFLASESTRPFPEPSEAEALLRAWVREITRAEADRRRLLNRLERCTTPAIADRLRHEIEALKHTIATAEKAVAALIAADPTLTRKAEIMASVGGVGAKTVRVLLAEMPEIGALDNGQATSLCGLAPHPKNSGKRKAGHIEGGRAALKRAAYLAAAAAILHNPQAKAFHQRLRERGKPYKLATVALARRLVATLNAMIRTDTEWDPHRFAPKKT
jgi:transposase